MFTILLDWSMVKIRAFFYMFLKFNVSRCFSFMDFTAVYVGSALLSHWSVVGVLIIMPWVLGFFMLTFVSHSVIWLC